MVKRTRQKFTVYCEGGRGFVYEFPETFSNSHCQGIGYHKLMSLQISNLKLTTPKGLVTCARRHLQDWVSNHITGYQLELTAFESEIQANFIFPFNRFKWRGQSMHGFVDSHNFYHPSLLELIKCCWWINRAV